MGNLSGLLLTPAALPPTGRQIFNFFILETWIVDVQCRCEVGCKRRFPDYVSPLNSKRDGWIRRAIRRLQWFLWGRSLGCDISWTAVGYGSLALDSFTFTSDYFLSLANYLIFSRFFHPEMKTRIQLRFKSSSPLRMCKQQGWQQLLPDAAPLHKPYEWGDTLCKYFSTVPEHIFPSRHFEWWALCVTLSVTCPC